MAIVERLFVTNYGAPINGTSDASPALAAWLADAATIVAGGNTPKLRMQGYSYHFVSTNTLSNGLKNAIIDGEGASVDALFLGNAGTIQQNFTNSARIATTAAGATSATIIQGPYFNDVKLDASFLSVGQWVMFAGIGMQGDSYPPNFQYNEYRRITNIAGNVISWSEPLQFAYLQTWPLADAIPITVSSATPAVVTQANHGFSANQRVFFSFNVGGSIPTGITRFQTYFVIATGLTANTFQFSAALGGAAVNTTGTGSGVLLHTQDTDLGGPATVYGCLPTFDGVHQYSNLTGTSAGPTFGGGTTSMILDNVNFTGLGACPSMSRSWIHRNSQIGSQNEIDKCVEYLEYNNCTGVTLRQLQFQSSGIVQAVVTNCTLATINGTPLTITVNGGTYTDIYAGATSFGRSNSIVLNNVTFTNAQIAGAKLELSLFTGWSFATGVFSFPLTRGITKSEAIRCFIPGHQYIVGFYDGVFHTTPDAGAPRIFTVNAIYQDATTFYVATNLASATFPTYGGQAANRFFSYGAKTVTQNGGGPGNLAPSGAPPRTFALHMV